MGDDLAALNAAFKRNYEYEQRLLERALGVEITEVVNAVGPPALEPDEAELYRRVVMRRQRRR